MDIKIKYFIGKMINMAWFYGKESRPFWNLINKMDIMILYIIGVKLQIIKWKIRCLIRDYYGK